MTDQELLGGVRSYLASHPELAELPDATARDVVDSLARRYERAIDARWWWQSVNARVEHLPYDSRETSLLLLDRLNRSARAQLMITADAPPPWPVITGTVADLLGLIQAQPPFEYMLAAEDGAWVVVDTNHAELVFIGPVETIRDVSANEL